MLSHFRERGSLARSHVWGTSVGPGLCVPAFPRVCLCRAAIGGSDVSIMGRNVGILTPKSAGFWLFPSLCSSMLTNDLDAATRTKANQRVKQKPKTRKPTSGNSVPTRTTKNGGRPASKIRCRSSGEHLNISRRLLSFFCLTFRPISPTSRPISEMVMITP